MTEQEAVAYFANIKLNKLIESWPVVYSFANEIEWSTEHYIGGKSGRSIISTKKARLAFVEEIKKESEMRSVNALPVKNSREYQNEITKLQEAVKVLREAVEFYGDEMNYSIDDYSGISGEMRRRCVLYKDCEERNDVYSYAGMRAREALSKADAILGKGEK